jgi:hypothetical protein
MHLLSPKQIPRSYAMGSHTYQYRSATQLSGSVPTNLLRGVTGNPGQKETVKTKNLHEQHSCREVRFVPATHLDFESIGEMCVHHPRYELRAERYYLFALYRSHKLNRTKRYHISFSRKLYPSRIISTLQVPQQAYMIGVPWQPKQSQ